ncbi:MAG: SpoIIE family protein phosphatase [Candidatus Ozemobacteraceae bacterium]
MKILVVEDDPMSLVLVSRILEKLGYEVLRAKDGLAAWETLQREPIGMVITDWMMPKLDGIELCSRIRANKNGRYTYIILLSAKAEVESLRDGLNAGADDFVGKPFDKEELIARIRSGERILALERQLEERILQLENANKLVEKSNERMKRDLAAAARLQASLLPTVLPTIPEAQFAWTYLPLEELAGDCFNVFSLDDHHMGFYVLDVSGHGAPAALLSVTLSHSLSLAGGGSSGLLIGDGRIKTPPEVLRELNRMFPIDVDNPQSFSIFYGILDRCTLEMTYSLSAHPQPVLVPIHAPPRFLEGSGLPIGMLDDADYDQFSIQLQKGDRLFIYTDGLSEAHNIEHKQFVHGTFFSSLEKVRALPFKESLSQLLYDCDTWAKGVGLQDDVAVLALELFT